MSSTLETGDRHTLSEMCLTPVFYVSPFLTAHWGLALLGDKS